MLKELVQPKPESNETITPEKYALISVTDKTGIADFAKKLDSLGYRIISTGGTAKVLVNSGLNVLPIESITGNPESFDGRMKTISYEIEGGILFDRSNPSHVEEAKMLGVKHIDIVVCNLYEFEKTVKNPDVTVSEAVESIDIGGPTMLRAAAKNFENVVVVVDPEDYDSVGSALESGTLDFDKRKALAAKTFALTSFYDALVARFLNKELFPQLVTLPGRKLLDLRYGENPHQSAAFYKDPNTSSPTANLEHLGGRGLSYVNVTDIWSGIEIARLSKNPTAVVVKHNSPSGIAVAESIHEALSRAIDADRESAFGGAFILNGTVDHVTAAMFAYYKQTMRVSADIIAAPDFTKEALEILGIVRKSSGVYKFGVIPEKRSNPYHYKFIDGGFIIQDWDDVETDIGTWRIAGEYSPTPDQFSQMLMGWKFIGRTKSNSVIVMDPYLPMTRGIGTGQTSRVRATKIALELAGEHARGAVLVSDSFFPFDDSIELAKKYGVAAILEQGGSINDEIVIETANRAGIPIVFTGQRKFWH